MIEKPQLTFRLIREIFLVSFLLLLTLPTGLAQIAADKIMQIHGADLETTPKPVIFLSALKLNWTSDQEPIMGVETLQMGEDAFRVYIDKRQINPVHVTQFAASPQGIDVVLAVDVSGPAYHQFARVKEAVSAYVSHIRPGRDQVAIVTFGTDVHPTLFKSANGVPAPFTDNVTDLDNAINTPPDKARELSTVLYQALTNSIELATHGRTGGTERAVIVLSDGHSEGDEGYDINAAIHAATSNKIPVFSLGLPEPSQKSKYHSVLERISRESGAVFAPIKSIDQLTKVLEKLDTLLKNQYVLTFDLPADLRDGGDHNVQVLASYEGSPLEARVDARSPMANVVRTEVKPSVAKPLVERGGAITPKGGSTALSYFRAHWLWFASGLILAAVAFLGLVALLREMRLKRSLREDDSRTN